MFEDVPGRLIGGALWGLGAGLVLRIIKADNRSQAGAGLRPVARTLVKGYVVASDRVRGLTAEARESLGDLYAEAQAERHTVGPDPSGGLEGNAGPGSSPTAAERRAGRRTRTRAASQAAMES